MHDNVWDKNAFQIQICCIIIAPTFICAAIYLTLKHVSLALNPSLSRLAPRWYPRLFLPADLSCLIVQAIGGGVAAAAKRDDPQAAESGNRTIIAGVALQVVVLLSFGAMGTDYFVRVRKYMRSSEADPAALRVWKDSKFRRFIFAVTGAYLCILVRCIYRFVSSRLFSVARTNRISTVLPKWPAAGATTSCKTSQASSSSTAAWSSSPLYC